MAWSLSLVLVIGSIVLVTYLHRMIQKMRKNAFVYPSEAIIDQMLPPEVFEQIFMRGDFSSIKACSLVSKYWNHHATKEQIQQNVLEKEVQLIASAQEAELRKDFAKISNTSYDSFAWKTHEYPAHYPLKWRIEDHAFAKKSGKILIDSSLDNAYSLHSTLYNNRGPRGNEDKYLVKLRGILQYDYGKKWTIKDALSTQNFVLQMDKLPDKYPFTRLMDCEVIVDLPKVAYGGYGSGVDWTDRVKRLRLLDFRPHFAGFPLSGILVKIAFLLLLPCLVVDFRSSTASEAKFYIMTLVTSFLAVVYATVLAGVDVGNGSLSVAKRRKAAAIAIASLGLVGFIFYRRVLEFTNYLSMLAGCTFFYIIADEVARTNYKYSKLVVLIASCLVFVMNDWKFTVDAFKNATILWTLLYNIGMHLQLAVAISLYMAYTAYLTDGKLVWRDPFQWRPPLAEIYLIELLTLLFITLYAPTTTDKIFG